MKIKKRGKEEAMEERQNKATKERNEKENEVKREDT
jgi:hypothetical protein